MEIQLSECSLLFYDALPQRSISNHGRLASTHLPHEGLRGVASQVLLSRTGDLSERFIFLSERGLGNENGLALQDATREAASGRTSHIHVAKPPPTTCLGAISMIHSTPSYYTLGDNNHTTTQEGAIVHESGFIIRQLTILGLHSGKLFKGSLPPPNPDLFCFFLLPTTN